MKIHFDTLGCDKNTADNEYLAGLLRQHGFEIANRTQARDFDAVLITTCGFIQMARDQSLAHIAQWVSEKERRRRPLAVFVSGCLSQAMGRELLDQFPTLDGLAGVGDFHRLADLITESLQHQGQSRGTQPFYLVNDTPEASIPYDIPREPLYQAPYAFLKISDGCNHTCTFCAIPSMKGKHRSIERERVLAEARRLIDAGVRELNLVAQDCSDYGKDIYGADYRIEHLLRDLCALDGQFWVRLFYLYPLGVTDALLDLWRNEPKLVPYVDMPLQHLAPTVLRRMKRPHLEARVDDTIARLRTIPGFTLRTTLIVGFPGETEDDFQMLLEGVERHRFNRLGVFTWSPEANTPSYAMPDWVEEPEKRRRRQLVMDRQARISHDLMRQRVGTTEEVLVESYDATRKLWLARGRADAPEVDGQVLLKAPQRAFAPGDFVRVLITGHDVYDVMAEAAPAHATAQSRSGRPPAPVTTA